MANEGELSADFYKSALESASQNARNLLIALHGCEGHEADTPYLAEKLEWKSYRRVNLVGGHLGKDLKDNYPEAREMYEDTIATGVLVTFDKRGGQWFWKLRPPVAEAMESLGWVKH